MSKHVFRHRFTAQLVEDHRYDPADPASYQTVLEKVAQQRKALTDLGCTIMMDDGRPVAIREAAKPPSARAAE